ncbi:MAG: hypothetical protein ACTSPV_11240, partial [Candidatus Hodarchaeales archaeon]
EISLREGEKPQIYTVTNIWNSPNNNFTFYGSFTIHSDKITNPDDVYVDIKAIDLVGNSVIGTSKTDDSTTKTSSTSFDFFQLLPYLIICLITFNKHRKRKL